MKIAPTRYSVQDLTTNYPDQFGAAMASPVSPATQGNHILRQLHDSDDPADAHVCLPGSTSHFP
jgi:hypothetical protein